MWFGKRTCPAADNMGCSEPVGRKLPNCLEGLLNDLTQFSLFVWAFF